MTGSLELHNVYSRPLSQCSMIEWPGSVEEVTGCGFPIGMEHWTRLSWSCPRLNRRGKRTLPRAAGDGRLTLDDATMRMKDRAWGPPLVKEHPRSERDSREETPDIVTIPQKMRGGNNVLYRHSSKTVDGKRQLEVERMGSRYHGKARRNMAD